MSWSTVEKIENAPDKTETYTYAGVPGAYRVDTITYASVSLGLSYVETFTYLDAGTVDERVGLITRS